MESVQVLRETAELSASPRVDASVSTAWLCALIEQRHRTSNEVAAVFSAGSDTKSPAQKEKEDTVTPASVHFVQLHAMHRRRIYLHYARELAHVSDTHYYYQFMMWCHDHNLFVHPSVQIHHRRSHFRQHVFTVRDDVPRLTPLLAIPESLLIGFKDANDTGADKNCLFDADKEKAFHKQNVGENNSSDADICEFFFASLGMIVSDLITAKSSPLTDARHFFAESLSKVQTLKNAPYFEDSVTFSSPSDESPSLADVLLQMIRNYVNGGPLVNKVPKEVLQFAVSICLSHSTPLTVGAVNSIGIIPFVHFFPHGGMATNAYVVARTARTGASEKMCAFFKTQFGMDFRGLDGGRCVYVVPERDLKAGEEVRLQAMAPVCDKDTEAQQMWRLSCGLVPDDFLSSPVVAERQSRLTQEIICGGEAALAKSKR